MATAAAGAGAGTTLSAVVVVVVVVFLGLCPTISSATEDDKCKNAKGECYDRQKALRLKIIAIFVILVTSLIGVCLPFFSGLVPVLRPDRNLFVLVKAFASGVILSTAYMHVLPDAFDDLSSSCLPENPWANFPFATFIAMLSSLVTLMLDSFMLSIYNKNKARRSTSSPSADVADHPSPADHIALPVVSQPHSDIPQPVKDFDVQATLLRHRIVAQVLEMGIIVHSVVIGLSLGTSESPCTIKPLIAALCFHQLFEGMGLGGCILQAEYKLKIKSIMAFFFATTTPFGIALGIGLTKVYDEDGPTALIVVGLLNAMSAGLLTYMALVELLAADFLGTKLQSSVRLQVWAYLAVLLGAGGMSLMAKWA